MSKIVVPIILFISAVGLWFSYISPSLAAISSMGDFRERLRQVVEDFNSYEQKRDGLAEAYRSFSKEDTDRVMKVLPDSIDAVRLIIDVDALARQNNLSIANFSLPRPGVTRGVRSDSSVGGGVEYSSAEFSVMLGGNYTNFKRFLTALESSLSLVDITMIDIAAGAEGEGTPGQYSYQITFNAYWLN